MDRELLSFLPTQEREHHLPQRLWRHVNGQCPHRVHIDPVGTLARAQVVQDGHLHDIVQALVDNPRLGRGNVVLSAAPPAAATLGRSRARPRPRRRCSDILRRACRGDGMDVPATYHRLERIVIL